MNKNMEEVKLVIQSLMAEEGVKECYRQGEALGLKRANPQLFVWRHMYGAGIIQKCPPCSMSDHQYMGSEVIEDIHTISCDSYRYVLVIYFTSGRSDKRAEHEESRCKKRYAWGQCAQYVELSSHGPTACGKNIYPYNIFQTTGKPIKNFLMEKVY